MCDEGKVSKKLIFSEHTSGKKMKEFGHGINRKFGLSIVFTLSFVILFAPGNSLPRDRSSYARTIRLCSKSLSDALYLVCQDRGGYNEPFSYSGEGHNRASSGPGLVEECCYRPCSYEQLEQYCKPLKEDENNGDNSQDGIEESLRIVNLPYDTPRELEMDKTHTVTVDKHEVQPIEKRKLRRVTEVRRKGKGRKHAVPVFNITKLAKKSHKGRRTRGRHKNVPYTDQNNNDFDSAIDRDVRVRPKHISRHHKRPKRPHRFKFLRNSSIGKVPEFKVGTILPDPKDSTILLFPSIINLVIQRTAKDLAASENTEKLE